MNITTLQTYIKTNMPKSVDQSLLSFQISKDDGIFLNLKDGKYTLDVGKAVTKDQANRVITVIYMDQTFGIKNEQDRLEKGYSEFSTAVAIQKYKLFKPEFVWVLTDSGLIKDQLIEKANTYCMLKKSGKVIKTSIYGLYPREIRFVEKEV